MNEPLIIRNCETIPSPEATKASLRVYVENLSSRLREPYIDMLREIQDAMKPKEKIKLPIKEETEYVKNLKAMQPRQEAYVHEKKHLGFLGWTFEELCRYLGFEAAKTYVKTLKRSQFVEDVYSIPVKTYCETFWDAYRIEIKNGDNLYYVIVGAIKGTDVFGLILNKGDKINQLEHYRDMEARLSIEGGFEELKKHYTHTAIENLNKSNSQQLISRLAVMQRPAARR